MLPSSSGWRWLACLGYLFLILARDRLIGAPPIANTPLSAPHRKAQHDDALRTEHEYLIFAAQEEQGRIDRHTGRYSLVLQDLAGSGGPSELRLTRSLVPPGAFPNSSAHLLGLSWRCNWECQLFPGSDREILIADGAVLRHFEAVEDGSAGIFRSASGESLILGKNNATWTRADGTTDRFDESGRLRSRTMSGTSISLTYSAAGRLARIEATDGGRLEFTYANDGKIHVSNAAGESVAYQLRDERLIRVDPVSGIATDYTYDGRGNLTGIVHAPFGSLNLKYDAQGRLVARRWQDGSVERIVYAGDHLVRHVDCDGAETVTQLDRGTRTAQITDPAGRRHRLRFDDLGRIVQATDAQGRKTSFGYDQHGRLAEWTGPDQETVHLGYRNGGSIPTRVTGPQGTDFALEYDDRGRVRQARRGSSEETSFEYGESGRVTAIHSSFAPGVSLAYDSQGRVQSVTDAAGNTSTTEYDARGNPIRQTNACGQVTTKSYDEAGRITSSTDPAGRTIRYEYAPSGMLAARIRTPGVITRLDYTGRTVLVTDPLGSQITYQYTPTGRLAEVISPLGYRSRYEYDSSGNLVCQTNPAGGTTLREYDDRGHVTRVTEPTGVCIEFEYDAVGNLVRTIDERGEKERFAYDEQGVLTSSQMRDGTIMEWEPGPQGPRIRSIHAQGPASTRSNYEYDAHGNVLRITRGEHVVVRCEYDELDRLIRQTNDVGLETCFRYDAVGRLIEWHDSMGESGRNEYDAAGRPVRILQNAQTVRRFVYDRSGNLSASIDALGHATRYEYSVTGQLQSVTTPLGDRVFYNYDAEGRLAEAQRGATQTLASEAEAPSSTSQSRVIPEGGVAARDAHRPHDGWHRQICLAIRST